MILETPRLILRPFAADDFDRMAELMANKDFMRFSMGPMTQEQTKSFLNKVIGWDRDGMPSQFAMIVRSSETLAGYCGFFHQEVDGKKESRLAIDCSAISGTADSPLKRRARCAITVFAI
jgi:RimJ/RimL family protein N-acetyltransferase